MIHTMEEVIQTIEEVIRARKILTNMEQALENAGWSDQWVAKGEARGRSEGKAEGKAEGQRELLALLESGKTIGEAKQILGLAAN